MCDRIEQVELSVTHFDHGCMVETFVWSTPYRIVLSRGAVSLFIEREIKCPSPDHPDDMFLGHIAHYYNLNVVFTSLFHQVKSLVLLW